MIDSDQHPNSIRCPLLKSASTDVIISNHDLRVFSNRCHFQILTSMVKDVIGSRFENLKKDINLRIGCRFENLKKDINLRYRYLWHINWTWIWGLDVDVSLTYILFYFRHAWCTKSDGEFLLFYINVLTSESSASDIFNEELGQAVEQCFYCLYGHPTKKGRYRHLVDHNSPWVQFTWERAAEIFEYFKPKTLPEFDSYKTDAVAGEVVIF